MIDPDVMRLVEMLLAALLGVGAKHAVDKRNQARESNEVPPDNIEWRTTFRREGDVDIREALQSLTDEFKAADALHEAADERRFRELADEGRQEKKEILAALERHEDRECETAASADLRRIDRAREFREDINRMGTRIDNLSLRIDEIVGGRK